jgi:hypothetical protein
MHKTHELTQAPQLLVLLPLLAADTQGWLERDTAEPETHKHAHAHTLSVLTGLPARLLACCARQQQSLQ